MTMGVGQNDLSPFLTSEVFLEGEYMVTNWNEHSEFSLAVALYFWLQHNWGGQTDPKYKAFCTLTEPGMFRPGTFLNFEKIEDDERVAYDELTESNWESALNKVLNYGPQT
jgi:hypothetical protein